MELQTTLYLPVLRSRVDSVTESSLLLHDHLCLSTLYFCEQTPSLFLTTRPFSSFFQKTPPNPTVKISPRPSLLLLLLLRSRSPHISNFFFLLPFPLSRVSTYSLSIPNVPSSFSPSPPPTRKISLIHCIQVPFLDPISLSIYVFFMYIMCKFESF